MTRQRTIILGGGLAGLSAAYHLGGNAPVYEQRASLGGLCHQVTADGFRFDVVPHVLHFRDDSMRALVSRLLEGRLASYERRAGVYSHGAYIRYPFQAHLFGLPAAVIEECVQGRLSAVSNGGPDFATFERWIRSTFGAGIAKHFMEPYNTKFWTLPPYELTCEWLDGLVPVPTVEQTIRGASQADASEYGYNVEFWYPSAGGLGTLFQALLRGASQVQLGKRLARLDSSARRLSFTDGEEVAYDQLLSSIPLPEWKGLLDPLPEEIARALDRLRWTSLYVVHLGVKGQAPAPWHWVYVPGDEAVFYRVGLPSHYVPDAAPAGHYILSAEIAHAPWRALDEREVTARAIADVRRMGLLPPGREIVTQTLVDLRYGYPIYDRHYAGATRIIRDYLRGCGIIPIGRFGSWRYLSMEQTLMDGQHVAQGVTKRLQRGYETSCEVGCDVTDSA